MKRKLLFIFLVIGLSLNACGSGNEDAASPSVQPPTSPNPEVAVLPDLQIFVRGESSPIQVLRGLHPNQQIQLEVRGQNLSSPVEWFTPHPYYATFDAPGLLHVYRPAQFLIGVIQGDRSKFVVVEVEEISSSPETPEEPPTESPPEETPPEAPPCTPHACDPSLNCGTVDNGCGGRVSCGECTVLGEACAAAGTANICQRIPTPPRVSSDRYIDRVVSFRVGTDGGFGSYANVLGAPEGRGGGILSLGSGGQIVVQSDTPILNGPGADFIVYENATMILWLEYAEVSVSQDGMRYVPFSCAPRTMRVCSGAVVFNPPSSTPEGCAGATLAGTFPSPEPPGGYSDEQLLAGGGVSFDLETVGLDWIRFIKIRDLETQCVLDPPGNTSGFDLEAIGILHQ